MGNFKQLKVWNRAHTLTLRLYTVTAQFPRSELWVDTTNSTRCRVN